MKISAGDNLIVDHQRIIRYRIELNLKTSPRFGQGVANRSMHLRSTAQ